MKTADLLDGIRKTGQLPSALPDLTRHQNFSAGMLGLWSSHNFVICYKRGRVPLLGIIALGQVTSDVSILIVPVPSPSEPNTLSERHSARHMAAGREPIARADAAAPRITVLTSDSSYNWVVNMRRVHG